ncbi:MAG TPA: hypothetical protein ENN47_05890 [Mesotoga infera]|uniref:Uncharacterized protein n=1 Tax=Mesotoga infera TaxID=1236046 RepID=A0A7C1GZR5_9BACT|nr:hypothetical protein [Mesotoga infera]
MSKMRFFQREVFGFFFIFFLGALLHMVYEWSNGNIIVGALTPVNESIWEHLKMIFLPGVFLLVLEALLFKEIRIPSLILGKTLGIYIMCGTILGGFYFYTLFIHHVLIIDILLMAAAVALGQLVSYHVSSRVEISRIMILLPLVMLVVLGVVFVIFTFIPPHWEPFKDSLTGVYGVQ